MRVYVDMVADLFHYGHVEFLRRAKELGDELVVGIHSDDAVASYKRRPIMTMDERVRVVEGCRYVDEVIPDAPVDPGEDWIERHRIDLVVHGDDFDPAALESFYGNAQRLGIFRTIPYTPGISTSTILERLAKRAREAE
jgi:glycerol-3-phosphate cytidylyltransferase